VLKLLSIVLFSLTTIYCLVDIAFLVGLFFPRRGRNRKRYRVSVVVAARNEEAAIARCLSDLISQTYPKALYEVIIVDDGSSDGTGEIIADFAAKYSNVRLLKADGSPEHYAPKKRAIDFGIRNSRGELILTTDADCRLRPTWIETMVSYFTSEVGMVVGFSQMGSRDEKYSLFEKLQALDFLSLMAAAAGAIHLRFPLAASGQNLAYRRSAYLEVGGFRTVGHRLSGDDVLLLQLIRQHTAWRIAFAADAGAFNTTSPEKTFSGFLQQRKRWASNGPYQIRLNKPFFAYIASVFLLNLLLFVTLPFSALSPSHFPAPLISLGVKSICDFAVILRGCWLFHRRDLLRYFPLWAILQPPYLVVSGFLGTFGRITWKGRHQSANFSLPVKRRMSIFS